MTAPNRVDSKPVVLELEPGTYAWCRCGLSSKHPFCDGSHSRQNTGLSPEVFKVNETGKVALCACKTTGNAPFCDGSHGKL